MHTIFPSGMCNVVGFTGRETAGVLTLAQGHSQKMSGQGCTLAGTKIGKACPDLFRGGTADNCHFRPVAPILFQPPCDLLLGKDKSIPVSVCTRRCCVRTADRRLQHALCVSHNHLVCRHADVVSGQLTVGSSTHFV
eukprot:104851-Pelagomonas_calceolata.AAC.3